MELGSEENREQVIAAYRKAQNRSVCLIVRERVREREG